MAKGKAKSGSVLDDVRSIKAKFQEEMKTKVQELKDERAELLERIDAIEDALMDAGEVVRSRKSGGGSGGGGGSIRWNSKWNKLIADAIGSGKTMDELKALDKKGEGLSVYQSALKLLKKGGLAKDGDKYIKGPNFQGK